MSWGSGRGPLVLVPIAADLAPGARRGQVVGTVMSGVFLGVLMARVIGGAVGQWLGWRAVFLGAALDMVGLAAPCWASFPGVG